MKYLVTGSSGFVGPYVIERLRGDGAHVIGVDRSTGATWTIDLMNRAAVEELVRTELPDAIVHLAAASSVAQSWKSPAETFANNTSIFLNVVEAVHRYAPRCRILSVGSAEVYGVSSEPHIESATVQPSNPYAVARVAQEHLAAVYVRGFNLDIVATRSFNHIGVGQTDQFVVSALARKFAELVKGTRDHVTVGATSTIRDFLDVRDVVDAYALVLAKGRQGEVYNVCSGIGVSIAEIVATFAELSGESRAKVVTDLDLVRPVENPRLVGSHAKLTAHTGWQPQRSLRETLEAIYEYWLSRV